MSTIEKALAKQKAAELAKQQQQLASSDENTVVDNATVRTTKQAENNSHNQTHAQYTDEHYQGIKREVITFDKEKLLKKGYLFDVTKRRVTHEEFRHVKRKLLQNAFGPTAKTLHHSNLIMVTSSKPNEGKTFVSINLALSIALEQDKTVLLVDADVLRPSLARELEFNNDSGLVEYLLGEVKEVRDIIYPTEIDNLKIIPSGQPHHLTNELLASSRMSALASELAERYPDRIVIFDCPPILGVTETPVLSNLMGQAVIVVEESKTHIDDVKAATQQLNENLAMGFVLNKTLKSYNNSYGYYGYGYGSKD